MATGQLTEAGELQGDRLGAERHPCRERCRPLFLQHLTHLRPEAVRVMELHHPAPRPRTLRRRSRVAIHRDDVVPAPGQSAAHE
jgi:hypothetical protein